MTDLSFIGYREPYLFRSSGRLFAIPSFWGGVASVLDLGATLKEYNQNRTDEEADSESIRSDWYAVGDDLRQSLASHAEQSS
jgi:hypothetical protein